MNFRVGGDTKRFGDLVSGLCGVFGLCADETLLRMYIQRMDMTGELVTIRVPKQLKRRTKTSNVNWSSELSNAIEHSLERRGYFRICSDKVLH
jgi:hypothetical protein